MSAAEWMLKGFEVILPFKQNGFKTKNERIEQIFFQDNLRNNNLHKKYSVIVDL